MESTMVEYRIGHVIPQYDISDGAMYCSKWGLTDQSETCEKNLRELLKSGQDFRTDWCDSQKELLSAMYARQDGEIRVTVNAWSDDLWDSSNDDLIYDALWAKLRREDLELPEYIIDSIRDAAFDAGCNDEHMVAISLPTDATYEDVMSAVVKAENEAMEWLHQSFEALQDIVAEHVTYMELEGKA